MLKASKWAQPHETGRSGEMGQTCSRAGMQCRPSIGKTLPIHSMQGN